MNFSSYLNRRLIYKCRMPETCRHMRGRTHSQTAWKKLTLCSGPWRARPLQVARVELPKVPCLCSTATLVKSSSGTAIASTYHTKRYGPAPMCPLWHYPKTTEATPHMSLASLAMAASQSFAGQSYKGAHLSMASSQKSLGCSIVPSSSCRSHHFGA